MGATSSEPAAPADPGRSTSAAVVLGVVAVTTIAIGAVVVWAAWGLGVRGWGFAFVINWSAMCWSGIVTRFVRPPMPDRFFEIRSFERGGRLYEWFGVRLVKLAVRRGPLHWFNPQLRLPAEPTPDGLRRLEQRMREPEADHAWLFVAMLLVAGHALVRGWWWAAVWTTVFNVAFNAYPVMLQRYNRGWLLRRLSGPGGVADQPLG
jgi:hypothetical protein